MRSARNRNDLLWETMDSCCVVIYKQDTKNSFLSPGPCFILAHIGSLALQPVKLLVSDTLSAGLLLESGFQKLWIITLKKDRITEYKVPGQRTKEKPQLEYQMKYKNMMNSTNMDNKSLFW